MNGPQGCRLRRGETSTPRTPGVGNKGGVAHSGQGARVCVDCTRRVICAVVSSISQASRCSTVASGNKRVKMECSDVEMNAVSSSRQEGLWGHVGPGDPLHQVGHAWVIRR